MVKERKTKIGGFFGLDLEFDDIIDARRRFGDFFQMEDT